MVCKKCNFKSADDAVYCSQCGARLDGKTVCGACGKEIPEESVFCMYCGQPVGNNRQAPTRSASAVRKAVDTSENSSTAKKVMQIVKQSLLYAALLVMFICSFFITFDLSITGTSYKQKINDTSFFFFIDTFKAVSEILVGKKYYAEYSTGFYLMAGLLAACVATVLLVTLIYFILGTVKYIKSLVLKQPVSMSKYVAVPAIINLAMLIFAQRTLYSGVAVYKNSAKISIGLGSPQIVTIICVSVFIIAAIIIHLIANGNFGKRTTLKYSLNGVGLLLSILMLITVSTAMVYGMSSADYNTNDMDSYPILVLFVLLIIAGRKEEIDSYDYKNINQALALFLMYVVLFAFAIALLWIFTRNILGNKQKRVAPCLLSGIGVLISPAYIVLSSYLMGGLDESACVSASPICAAVFTTLIFIYAIVVSCIIKNRSPQSGTKINELNFNTY